MGIIPCSFESVPVETDAVKILGDHVHASVESSNVF